MLGLEAAEEIFVDLVYKFSSLVRDENLCASISVERNATVTNAQI